MKKEGKTSPQARLISLVTANAPGLTSFDQIARLVTALGGRIVIETPQADPVPPDTLKKDLHRKTATPLSNHDFCLARRFEKLF